MKLGQWARLKDGHITQGMINGTSTHGIKEVFDAWLKLTKKRIVNTANTPQELIEVGDLVFSEPPQLPFIVQEVYKEESDIFLDEGLQTDEWVNIKEIKEIWTKRSEDTYTRQWRKL